MGNTATGSGSGSGSAPAGAAAGGAGAAPGTATGTGTTAAAGGSVSGSGSVDLGKVKASASAEALGLSASGVAALKKTSDAAQQQQQQREKQRQTDDARYAALALASAAGKVSREAILESFGVRLSKEVAKRFFDALNGGVEVRDPSHVDFGTFTKVVHVLERAGRNERRKLVFCMFDPAGQGRVRQAEFRKMMVELMRGFDGVAPAAAAPPAFADSNEFKTLAQTLTDAAFALYCVEPKRGLTFDEWFAFVSDDAETCRLLGALDKRSRNRVVEMRDLARIVGPPPSSST